MAFTTRCSPVVAQCCTSRQKEQDFLSERMDAGCVERETVTALPSLLLPVEVAPHVRGRRVRGNRKWNRKSCRGASGGKLGVGGKECCGSDGNIGVKREAVADDEKVPGSLELFLQSLSRVRVGQFETQKKIEKRASV